MNMENITHVVCTHNMRCVCTRAWVYMCVCVYVVHARLRVCYNERNLLVFL